MFVDRDAELARLDQLYRSDRAELVVLYGRRRVGKTELLQAFCQGKPHLFFVATLASEADQLAAFSQAIWAYTHPQGAEGVTFPSWEAAFAALADLPGRPIVALDEFTYLISGNPAIPSILQKVWDAALSRTRVLLVLCGSYVGLMERQVLGYGAALYGRRTASQWLDPLPLGAVRAFVPRYSAIQQIEAWAIFGGMPYYLRALDPARDPLANARALILDPSGLLYNEPTFLFMEELREPRHYYSLLRAIAQGRTRLSEIAQAAGVTPPAAASRYLDVLREMRLVERRVPADDPHPEKSKKGLYRLADPFLRFWFRYVHPHQGALELGLADAVLEQRLRPTFDAYVGYAFEEAARDYIARLARQGALPFLPERLGSWWDRQSEIDLMAVSASDRALLLGECKWWAQPVGLNVLRELQARGAALLAAGPWQRAHYALFAKTSFTPELRQAAQAEGVLLVTAEEMVKG